MFRPKYYNKFESFSEPVALQPEAAKPKIGSSVFCMPILYVGGECSAIPESFQDNAGGIMIPSKKRTWTGRPMKAHSGFTQYSNCESFESSYVIRELPPAPVCTTPKKQSPKNQLKKATAAAAATTTRFAKKKCTEPFKELMSLKQHSPPKMERGSGMVIKEPLIDWSKLNSGKKAHQRMPGQR